MTDEERKEHFRGHWERIRESRQNAPRTKKPMTDPEAASRLRDMVGQERGLPDKEDDAALIAGVDALEERERWKTNDVKWVTPAGTLELHADRWAMEGGFDEYVNAARLGAEALRRIPQIADLRAANYILQTELAKAREELAEVRTKANKTIHDLMTELARR